MKSALKIFLALIFAFVATISFAQSRAELINDSKLALAKLLATDKDAAAVSKQSVAVLIFPKIIKAGFFIGGHYGEGVLFSRENPVGFYNTAGGSFGLQIGGQEYGYALFFKNQKSLEELDKTNGFELGVSPSIVVDDQGAGKSHTNITLTDGVDAFIFNQSGYMASTGIQGNKITKLDK